MSGKHQREVARLLGRHDDEQKKIVLVVGAGLHKYLALHGAVTHNCGLSTPLTDWTALITRVAKENRLFQARHVDPAADWEALVCKLATRELIQAASAETKLLRQARNILREAVYGDSQLRPVGAAILERYRHVISLNIDNTLVRSLRAAGAHPKLPRQTIRNKRGSWLRMHDTLAHGRGAITSVWYPHGSIEAGHEFILGTRKYGTVITELGTEFERYKERLGRKRLPAHRAYTEESWGNICTRTLAITSRLNWVRLFMVCDLIFIGTSLDRAETDLWWALHQRQRNLARVPESIRPRTFLLAERGSLQEAKHLHTEPAGVVPVCYDKWDDAWAMALGRHFAEADR